jgi:NMD protein affecting ribosome stability and mRNA decay
MAVKIVKDLQPGDILQPGNETVVSVEVKHNGIAVLKIRQHNRKRVTIWSVAGWHTFKIA